MTSRDSVDEYIDNVTIISDSFFGTKQWNLYRSRQSASSALDLRLIPFDLWGSLRVWQTQRWSRRHQACHSNGNTTNEILEGCTQTRSSANLQSKTIVRPVIWYSDHVHCWALRSLGCLRQSIMTFNSARKSTVTSLERCFNGQEIISPRFMALQWMHRFGPGLKDILRSRSRCEIHSRDRMSHWRAFQSDGGGSVSRMQNRNLYSKRYMTHESRSPLFPLSTYDWPRCDPPRCHPNNNLLFCHSTGAVREVDQYVICLRCACYIQCSLSINPRKASQCPWASLGVCPLWTCPTM